MFPYTPATNLLFGLRESLGRLHAEGLEQVFARHDRHAEATRRAVRAWGLEVLCEDDREYSSSPDSGPAARRARRRRGPGDHPAPLRHVARGGPGPAEGAGLPHRSPPSATSTTCRWPHAVRRGKWACASRRPARGQRRRGGARPPRAGRREGGRVSVGRPLSPTSVRASTVRCRPTRTPCTCTPPTQACTRSRPLAVVAPAQRGRCRRHGGDSGGHRVPVLARGRRDEPRGADGRACGVLDFSRHLRHIVALDAEAAHRHGPAGRRAGTSSIAPPLRTALMFGADTSTSNRADARRHDRQQLVGDPLHRPRDDRRPRHGARCRAVRRGARSLCRGRRRRGAPAR